MQDLLLLEEGQRVRHLHQHVYHKPRVLLRTLRHERLPLDQVCDSCSIGNIPLSVDAFSGSSSQKTSTFFSEFCSSKPVFGIFAWLRRKIAANFLWG